MFVSNTKGDKSGLADTGRKSKWDKGSALKGSKGRNLRATRTSKWNKGRPLKGRKRKLLKTQARELLKAALRTRLSKS